MLKRLTALVAAASLMSLALLFGTASPAAAYGNGVQIVQLTDVSAASSWLTDIRDADAPPETVVLKASSQANAAAFETIAQSMRSAGVKVLGSVSVMSGGSLRTRLSVGTEMDWWISPFNPSRTIGGQMVDGIYLADVPSTCGASGVNTLAVSDFTDAANDKFAFWSYNGGDAQVWAGIGTAVEDCMPGWAAFGPMPDRYVTFAGTYSSYISSYLGGNVYSSGPTYYNGSATFGNDKFVHAVYNVSSTDMPFTLRLADARGAGYVFPTDDVASNWQDTEPTYMDASVAKAEVPNLIFEDTTDLKTVTVLGTTGYQFQLNSGAAATKMLDVAEDECGVAPTDSEWGDIGDSVDTLVQSGGQYGWTVTWTTALNSTFVSCMRNEWFVETATPNNSAVSVCDDNATAQDCKDPDGSTTSNLVSGATNALRSLDNDDVELLLVLFRDRLVEDGQPGGGVNCTSTANKRCLPRPFPQSQTAPNCITVSFTSNMEFFTGGRHVGWDPVCF